MLRRAARRSAILCLCDGRLKRGLASAPDRDQLGADRGRAVAAAQQTPLIEIKESRPPARQCEPGVTGPHAGGMALALTSDMKTKDSSRAAAAQPACSASNSRGLAAAALLPHASLLRTRAGQTLPFTSDRGEQAFIVGAGALALHVTLPGAACQVAALLFPGDIFRSRFVPPQAEAALVSAGKAEIWRLRMSALEGLAARDPAVARIVDAALVDLMARRAVHAVMLGRFDCEQKVATLLVELALRIGTQLPGGIAFDVPFARGDIAAYLGLNPDTLSRIMSRLRRSGVFSRCGRNQILLRDFQALAALTPAAHILAEMQDARSALPG